MSLQTLMPASALQPAPFTPSFDVDTPLPPDDGLPSDDAGAGGSSKRASGTSELPPEVDKLLQQLMQVLTESTGDNGASDPSAATGQGGAGGAAGGQASGGGGLDPQIAEMLAYIARMFEARMQQQQQASQPDQGVSGVDAGGGGVPAAAGASAGAAPAADPATGVGGAAAAGPAPAVTAAQDTTAPPVTATGGAPGAGLTNNAGGVPQAAAIDGVAPNATKAIDTGTGTDRTFNVTNDTSKTKSFEYETEGQEKAVMTLAPGETQAFKASSKDLGVRIENSDAQGKVKPDEQLFETGGADNGQGVGVSNDDISNVDGDQDVDGNAEKMTDTLSDGRQAGDGDAIRPYQNPTDDAAAMGLAGDSSKTSNIVVSD